MVADFNTANYVRAEYSISQFSASHLIQSADFDGEPMFYYSDRLYYK